MVRYGPVIQGQAQVGRTHPRKYSPRIKSQAQVRVSTGKSEHSYHTRRQGREQVGRGAHTVQPGEPGTYR